MTEPTTAPKPRRHRRGPLKDAIIRVMLDYYQEGLTNFGAGFLRPDPYGRTAFDTRVVIGVVVDRTLDWRHPPGAEFWWLDSVIDPYNFNVPLAIKVAGEDFHTDVRTLHAALEAYGDRSGTRQVEPKHLDPAGYNIQSVRERFTQALADGLDGFASLGVVAGQLTRELRRVGASPDYRRAYHSERTKVYQSIKALEDEGTVFRDRESRDRVLVGFTPGGFEKHVRVAPGEHLQLAQEVSSPA